jgi:hypothetical protein
MYRLLTLFICIMLLAACSYQKTKETESNNIDILCIASIPECIQKGDKWVYPPGQPKWQ